MLCKDVMKRNVDTLTENDNVQLAAKKMRDGNIGFLPVCDANKRVVGTITDRDLAVRILADAKAASTRIADVMSRDVISCHADEDLRKAEQLMGAQHKSRIICVDGGGTLAGIISLSDIVQRDNSQEALRTLREVTAREAHI